MDIDAFYIKRLNKILLRVNAQAKIQSDLNISKLQRRKEINKMEEGGFLGDIGIDEEVNRKRK